MTKTAAIVGLAGITMLCLTATTAFVPAHAGFRSKPEPKDIYHIVECAGPGTLPDGTKIPCMIKKRADGTYIDYSFDMRVGRVELLNLFNHNRQLLQMEQAGERLLKERQAWNCKNRSRPGKTQQQSMTERHHKPQVDPPKGRRGSTTGSGCDFGDPECPNCWTHFSAPGGDYCMDACVNCECEGPGCPEGVGGGGDPPGPRP
jgi:hypothetical protein